MMMMMMIVKSMLDTDRTMPIFYATDLSRIPSVDLKYCDFCNSNGTKITAFGAG